jgi:hypothetical protein
MSRRLACPDLEAVAAYLDRRLAVAERLQFEEHLGGCGQCAALVADSIRTLGDLPERIPVHGPGQYRASPGSPLGNVVWTRAVPGSADTTRGRHERPYWGALAAAATIVAMFTAPALLSRLEPRDTRLADLAEAVGERRLVEGRLTGGFPHAPLGAPLAGGQGGATVETVRLELAAGRIREDIDRRTTPERLHAFGVSQLLLGRYDDAAMALAAAVREQPRNARYLNDAATVYLERARRGLRPDDLPRALAAAERARTANPSLTEAWFNRALALSRLSLRDQARDAWNEYLLRDATSPWAGEARTYLAENGEETPAVRWRTVEGRLRAGVTALVADAAVRLQMSSARHFVESELIPAWADRVARGADDASGPREALRVLADAFSRVAGDDLYRDAVQAIDRAESRGAEDVRRLAAAHLLYADAQALFADDRFADAAAGLAASRAALAASESAFSQRAAIDLAAVAYVSGRSAEALTSLDEIGNVSRRARHAYVAARVSWFQGLIAFGQGRLSDARARYDDALAAFEEAGDAEQATALHGVLAALHDYLGDESEAWRHRLEALRGLSLHDSPRFRYSILSGVAGATWRQQSAEAALPFQNLVIATAQALGRTAALAEGLAQRSAILGSLGQDAEAARDAADARTALGAIRDEALRSRIEVLVLEAEIRLRAANDPASAGEASERAIALINSRNDRARLPNLYLQLARAKLSTDTAAANRALAEGLAAFEAQGVAGSTDEAWGLYDLATRLALDAGDTGRAFELADKARGRGLVAGSTADAVRSRLQAEEAVIAISQFDDELVLWLVDRMGVEPLRRPLTRLDGQRLIARFRDEVRLESAAPQASAALFNELVRPFAARLRGVTHLVIVPDSSFESVPFAGLWDSEKRRFLVENQSIRVASSMASVAGRPDAAVAVPASFVDIAGGITADRAAQLLAGAPERSIVHLSARAKANADHPLRSRLQFSDVPGRPHSGMTLLGDLVPRAFSNADVVILSNIDGAGTPAFASVLLSTGVGSVVAAVTPIDPAQSTRLFDDLRASLGRASSAADSVALLQRDVLRQTGHRLGAWSTLMVYSAGR